MAPIKFEDEIKKKLGERKISPSEKAWEQISNRLETPNSKKKNSFAWYAVAASFIGILIISTVFFNSGDAISGNGVEIVDEPIENKVEEKKSEIVVPILNEEVYVAVEENKLLEKETTGKRKEINIKKEMVATNNKSQAQNIKENPLSNTEKIIDSKIAEVVAQVNLMEKDNNLLTDMEVDSLLRKAQTEILTNKIFMENQKVDAMALLNEVEDELDNSFRDQIFDSLKSGFLKVRTAVADRNN